MAHHRTSRYSTGIKAGLSVLLLLFGVACAGTRQQAADSDGQVWRLHSLESIGEKAPIVWGSPKVIGVGDGERALEFDGENDGLLLKTNPIAGAEAFEIEVAFKPYAAFPDNIEQRFLHIQEPDNPDRRILIELRLNNRQEWYADFFMRTENAALTLIDSTKTHPVNEWAMIKMTYKDGQLKGFVNGVEEVSGAIEYLPISPAASTSIGTRMDKRSWFKGAIKSVRFTKQGISDR